MGANEGEKMPCESSTVGRGMGVSDLRLDPPFESAGIRLGSGTVCRSDELEAM